MTDKFFDLEELTELDLITIKAGLRAVVREAHQVGVKITMGDLAKVNELDEYIGEVLDEGGFTEEDLDAVDEIEPYFVHLDERERKVLSAALGALTGLYIRGTFGPADRLGPTDLSEFRKLNDKLVNFDQY